jgi:hypothetical protein
MDTARIDDAVRQLEREDIARFKESDGFKGFTSTDGAGRSSARATGSPRRPWRRARRP